MSDIMSDITSYQLLAFAAPPNLVFGPRVHENIAREQRGGLGLCHTAGSHS